MRDPLELAQGQAPSGGADPRDDEEFPEGARGRHGTEVVLGYVGKWGRNESPEETDPGRDSDGNGCKLKIKVLASWVSSEASRLGLQMAPLLPPLHVAFFLCTRPCHPSSYRFFSHIGLELHPNGLRLT